MSSAWKVKKSRLLFERKWLTIREDHVVLPTGHEIEEFHVIGSPDWVGVLALTEDRHVLVVDQYRHGIERVSRELPAGVIDAGESPLDAARRELLEEAGAVAEQWDLLVSFSTEPTRHATTAHFFVARGARITAGQSLDESENLSVSRIAQAELFDQIDSGVIRHATHIAAILLAARRGFFD